MLRSAPALRFPCCAWVPARAFLRSRCPASLERPGRAVRDTPVHRAKGPLDPLQCSGSPVAWAFAGTTPSAAHSLLRLGTGPSHSWLGRSPGRSLRFALPAALGHRPKPFVAWAFAGTTVHRTVVFLRLTHRTLVLFRLTHWTVVFLRRTHRILVLFRFPPIFLVLLATHC